MTRSERIAELVAERVEAGVLLFADILAAWPEGWTLGAVVGPDDVRPDAVVEERP